MAGEGVHLLAVNQNFQAAHLRYVGFEGARDGIDGELLAQNSGGSGSGERFGKVGDGSSIRQKIEGEERGVWGKSAQIRFDRASQECVQNLFGAQHWIFGERKFHVDRGEGTFVFAGSPK